MENPLVAGVLVALLVPFLGNTLGAALVLFARHGMSERFTKALLGFAAGVMIAASVWSLITPALEAAEGGPVPAWAPAAVGFLGRLPAAFGHRPLHAPSACGLRRAGGPRFHAEEAHP